MSDYGSHPTRFGHLSNQELYSMYRSSVYNNLHENMKLELLQETVNREALEWGEIGAPKVEFADLPSNVSGTASNGIIQINYELAVNGRQLAEYQGKTIEHMVDDYNIQTLNTVIHENVHCFQDQVTEGIITCPDSQLAAQYMANSFTASAVLEKGNYSLGSHYMTGETPGGYFFYYFQATERDAHLWAEMKTEKILEDLTAKYGTENSFQAYEKSLQANGYHVMEQNAAALFQNPNFEKDVNQVLMNQHFGTSVPVHPATERAVKSEMTASYNAMRMQLAENIKSTNIQEEKNMSFNPKPVTLEEYNASLRNTVNEFYTHSMNDPTLSHEQAIAATGQVSENYLNAVSDFQENAGLQSGSPDLETSDLEGSDLEGPDLGEDLGDDMDL